MKNKIFLGLFAVLVAVTPFSAYAGTFEAGESYQLNSGSSVEGNLYTVGANVIVAGKVGGDIFAAGGTVIVSGPVGADMMAAGGNLNITGDISGDARVGGGTIIFSSNVGGELLAAGGNVHIISDSSVSDDATIAGGTVNYDGTVKKNLTISAEKVYMNGTVFGDVSIHAQEITLGPDTSIKGNLEYYAPKEATIEDGATIGGAVDFQKTELPTKKTANKGFAFGFITMAWIIKSLMLLAAALVAIYLLKSQTTMVIKDAESSFWKEAGKGFVVLVVLPVAIVVSFITVIGIPLGIIGLLFYGIFLIISSVIAPLLFARLVMKYVFKKENYELNWWVAALSIFVFGAVYLIPVVGWIFGFIIFLATFGSVSHHLYKKLK